MNVKIGQKVRKDAVNVHVCKSGKVQRALPLKAGTIKVSWDRELRKEVDNLNALHSMNVQKFFDQELQYLQAETLWNWVGEWGQVNSPGGSPHWGLYANILHILLRDRQEYAAQRFAAMMKFYKILPR